MPEYSLPPSDEPFDFRRQASGYARWRRDYSAGLYDAIAARAGRAGTSVALDLGCGTGLVAFTLAERGWRVLGVDFSAPMLAEAGRLAASRFALASARAEALPVRDATVGLVTCGTAFHWFAPAPTLAEVSRVLAPGGWVALFWRYDGPGEPYMKLAWDLLREFSGNVPVVDGLVVHPERPFAGSELTAEAPLTLASTLDFTPESFHGYVATLESVRRFAGEAHATFLSRLREEVARRWPDGFRERVVEYLFLARKPGRP